MHARHDSRAASIAKRCGHVRVEELLSSIILRGRAPRRPSETARLGAQPGEMKSSIAVSTISVRERAGTPSSHRPIAPTGLAGSARAGARSSRYGWSWTGQSRHGPPQADEQVLPARYMAIVMKYRSVRGKPLRARACSPPHSHHMPKPPSARFSPARRIRRRSCAVVMLCKLGHGARRMRVALRDRAEAQRACSAIAVSLIGS